MNCVDMNKDNKTNMHAGHRERVREKYMKGGLDSFADHEVLELLLFYANTRGDTNPVAHELIKRFGSVSAVLEASYDDLRTVKGVGDAAATLITLMPQLFRRYSQDKAEKIKTISDVQSAADYLIPRFYGFTNERVGILCLDVQGRVKNFVFVSDGSLKLAHIDLRRTAQIALQNNADSVILAHNHPDGMAAPSRSDIETTKALINALRLINIRVADHMIFSDKEFFSMAASMKFAPMFIVNFPVGEKKDY